MAEVLLASRPDHEGRDQLVAIKRIRPELLGRAEYVQLFDREAEIAKSLRHPNIAGTFESVRLEDERFLVMEYVHGRSLKSLMRASSRTRRLRLDAALAIFRDAALALHHVHELGFIHRDVSPGNIVIRNDGVVKLVDFGIAKSTLKPSITITRGRTRSVTIGGTLKGSMGYMSPEQCRGDELDRRSDIYCLALLLYEATTNRRAFHGHDDVATLGLILRNKVVRPRALDPTYSGALEAILARALSTAPENRFQTAREFADALDRLAGAHGMVLTSTPIAAELERLAPIAPLPMPDARPRIFDPWVRADAPAPTSAPYVRHRRDDLRAAFAGVALAVLGVTIVTTWPWSTDPSPSTPAANVAPPVTAQSVEVAQRLPQLPASIAGLSPTERNHVQAAATRARPKSKRTAKKTRASRRGETRIRKSDSGLLLD